MDSKHSTVNIPYSVNTLKVHGMRESGSAKVFREKQRQNHHISLRALKK